MVSFWIWYTVQPSLLNYMRNLLGIKLNRGRQKAREILGSVWLVTSYTFTYLPSMLNESHTTSYPLNICHCARCWLVRNTNNSLHIAMISWTLSDVGNGSRNASSTPRKLLWLSCPTSLGWEACSLKPVQSLHNLLWDSCKAQISFPVLDSLCGWAGIGFAPLSGSLLMLMKKSVQ